MSQNKNRIGFWENSFDRARARDILSYRNFFIGDSDTVVGLYAPLTLEGFQILNEIKGRQKKPYLILLDSIEAVQKFTDIPDNQNIIDMLHAFWPGPLTVIFKAYDNVPSFMKSSEGTIAIRIPDNTYIQAFVRDVGGVFSTSANYTGQPVPEQCDLIDPQIRKQADIIMKHGSPLDRIVPSTIVDCSQGECFVVREGAVSKDALYKVLHRKVQKK